MKKAAISILSGLLVLLSSCGAAPEEPASRVETKTQVPSEESQTEDKEEQPVEIDVFQDLAIEYSGWNGLGQIQEIKTEDCSQLVRNHVEFSLQENPVNLANGDIITVVASFDEQALLEEGYQAKEKAMEFEVEGLPFITDYRDYHDGVAWVKVIFNDTTKWTCCDQEGNILFSLDEASEPTTDFAQGVAVVDSNRVVNKSGETVWSIEKEGTEFGSQTWGQGSVTNIWISYRPAEEEFFGYTFVVFEVDSYEISGSFTGILDPEGQWYAEPALKQYRYAEDGLYEYYVPNGYDLPNESQWYLYNVLTNETEEGKNGNRDYSQYVAWQNAFKFARQDGLMFTEDEIGCCFVDANGNRAIDLSKYNINYYGESPVFHEGYCLLEVSNEQGAYYYTVIDTAGVEQFPPQKGVEHGELRCGYYWVPDVGYMNVKGEPAFDKDFLNGTDFSENMAFVSVDGGMHAINTDGEIVF